MPQFTFLDMAGKTLFIRDDAERALWTVEEMSLELEFPYFPDKRIEPGQRVFFTDPATGSHQIYEIKQAKTLQPDNYQSVTAEHIIISELTDAHIDNTEITDQTISSALSTLLTQTEWHVGTTEVDPTSSADLSRGSVWNAFVTLKANYNVYLEPRVILNSNGSISKYIDVIEPGGKWNGLRLSVDKNMLDPSVTIDDTNVVTALYGYGGTLNAASGDDEEVTFEEVVWEGTESHPPKPYGYKFIEDPKATQKFGRNNHPRFGFYQNSDITDAETLLEKTWEALSASNTPDVSIDGTVADLYRMGYADEPIKLHDLVLVEVNPSDFTKQIELTKMTVDLLDPSATTVNLGSYIPNIIYITRDTNTSATGSGAGSNNKSGSTNSAWKEFETTLEAYKDGTGMQIKAVHNKLDEHGQKIQDQEGRIEVAYNKIEMEVIDRRNADGELSSKITVTASQIRSEVKNTASGLRSQITQTASQIRLEVKNSISGLNSTITQTASQIRMEVENSVSELHSAITQEASQIRLEVQNAVSGLESSITQEASQIRTEVTNAVSGLQSSITQNANKIALVVTDDNTVDAASIVAGINGQTGSYVQIKASTINLSGYVTASQLEATNALITDLTTGITRADYLKTTQFLISDNYFTIGGNNAKWKSFTHQTLTYSSSHNFLYGTNGNSVNGQIVTGKTSTTIYYLGHD